MRSSRPSRPATKSDSLAHGSAGQSDADRGRRIRALTLKRCPPRIAPEHSSVGLDYHENAPATSPPIARKWHVFLAISGSRAEQGFPRVATPKKICARAKVGKHCCTAL